MLCKLCVFKLIKFSVHSVYIISLINLSSLGRPRESGNLINTRKNLFIVHTNGLSAIHTPHYGGRNPRAIS